MTSKNYAYYKVSTGEIENIIYVDENIVSELVFPDGYKTVQMPNNLMGEYSACGIGWFYIDGEFIEPSKSE